MADVIAVLNAGSSSVKFSLFVVRGDALDLHVRGQIEGIDTAPHFVAKRHDGVKTTEKSWPEGAKLGHDGALDHLIAFLRDQLADDRLVGVGHRVVHGGPDYAQPVAVDTTVLRPRSRS
jgi:acetate kinase